MMMRRACSSLRRLAILAAAVALELTALAGAPSDAAEYSRVQRDDDEDRRDDRPDDHKRDIEGDVDVSHLRQDVAVRQFAVRATPVHDADGEGGEAGEGEAGDGLGEDDSTGV